MSGSVSLKRRLIFRGQTLIELVMAMSAVSVLLAGLGSAVIVSAKALRPESLSTYKQAAVTGVEQELIADFRLATSFAERTDKAATFTVPDRDGDGIPETLRYAWSGLAGDPLTFSLNGGTAQTIASDIRSFSLSYITQSIPGAMLPAEQDGSRILLLVNDSDSLSVAEVIRKTTIESWNFVVETKGLNDGLAAILAESDLAAAVYISSQINSSSMEFVVDQLSSRRIGIVNEHRDFVDDLGFASSTGTSILTSSLSVTNNTHYITNTVSSGSQSMGLFISQYWLEGTLAGNLNTLGTVSSKPGLSTVDPDELLCDGRLAAGRRVVLPWGNSDALLLNSTCQTLTRRAIEWATGIGDESPDLKIFGFNTVFTSQNGASNIQYATFTSLPENGILKSISAYVGGANDQVRFAIYRDKNGQPDQLIVQTAVGNSTTSMAWVTLTVPDTNLSAGNYWLAFSFKNANQKYRYNSVGLGERNKSNAAVNNGFSSSWGTSNNSYSGSRSIYATYEVAK